MSWVPILDVFLPPPDLRPIRAVEQEIRDELEFHIEMRTLDNLQAGLSAEQARQDAVRRFGNFEQIERACRRTLLGERIMLQRVQTILTLVLLAAVVVMGVALYRGQRQSEAATARMMEMLDKLAEKNAGSPPVAPVAMSPAKEPAPAVPPKDRPKVVSVSPAPDAADVDPVTEIRIRFDRPMDPNRMGFHQNYDYTGKGVSLFRLRGSPQYRAESKEFVVPVILKPGAQYAFSLKEFACETASFRSLDGTAAAPYAWRFKTRAVTANPKAVKPRVVSIDPPSGAQVGMATTVRVRFDRPMDPEAFELVDVDEMETSVSSPVEYDASSQSFVFETVLPRNAKLRIKLQGFRGTDGGTAEPATVEYQVGRDLYTPAQEKRIAEAGRSVKLREVVEAVRRNRLALKSLEETVLCTMLYHADQHSMGWLSGLDLKYGRFAFQGERQFYADVTSIMEYPSMQETPSHAFRLGGDGRQCWFFTNEYDTDTHKMTGRMQVIFCPFEAIRDKRVVMGDSFGSKRFSSAEQAIKELKLEYLGELTRNGKTCHRVRSWIGEIFRNRSYGFCDWLIDAQSLLPMVCERPQMRYDFLYRHVNEPIASEVFQSPSGVDFKRKPNKLEEGYDHFNLSACDGSDGRMSARWGQQGPKGGSGSGLN